MIALFDYDDHEMRHCKDGDFWIQNGYMQKWLNWQSALGENSALERLQIGAKPQPWDIAVYSAWFDPDGAGPMGERFAVEHSGLVLPGGKLLMASGVSLWDDKPRTGLRSHTVIKSIEAAWKSGSTQNPHVGISYWRPRK